MHDPAQRVLITVKNRSLSQYCPPARLSRLEAARYDARYPRQALSWACCDIRVLSRPSRASYRTSSGSRREIARSARLMHDNGVNHRDFYLCHFHLMPPFDPASGPAARPELRLIDLHRVQLRSRPTPRRWRVKDIGGLLHSALEFGVGRGDRLRFARLYSGRPLRETLRRDAAFWRAVQRRAHRLYVKAHHEPPPGMAP